MRKSQELTSFFQNEHNEEVAKDGTVWTTAPSDTVSLGRRQQHNVLREEPGPSSFAISVQKLYLAAINAWIIHKEITGIKIKRRDYILNLADELPTNYVSSKTSTLSDFTSGADDAPTTSSRKRKQFQINQCRKKTMNISCDCKR
ncbi:hypothetical protein AVEN_243692-1 [Araneus ventricosus]|uniref:Uncharacterized protein n=1 Tax=Araneus ventricosus TaxID=182803 RepID=A0A4Y2A544_ARAVE|nr:hypothetical protein AVEN_243692-1 [Araneus ventricosus]